jgi:hypothetical protein
MGCGMPSLRPRKASVDLAAPPVVRVSRIRRDPPEPVKILTAHEIRERDARDMAIGIALLTIGILILLAAVTNVAGWSLGGHIIRFKEHA